MTEFTSYELDLIVQALEFFADQGSGKGDLEIAEIRELANKVVAIYAIDPEAQP